MTKYKARDLQFDYRYYADGELFESKADLAEALIEYHSIDFSGTDDKDNELEINDYLAFWKFDTQEKRTDWVLEYGQWEIEEVEVNNCPYCKGDFEITEGHNCDIGRIS